MSFLSQAPAITGDPTYRLVVTASQLKAKQFVWVIVDESQKGLCVQTSKQTFRSLEDAYNAGQSALAYWRAKAMRTQTNALLAPSASAKRAKAKVPGANFRMTSGIYSRG